VIFESTNADFRPLQIAHNADCASARLCRRSEQVSPSLVIVSFAMRKIQTRHIKARLNHFAQRFRVV
jgi:hypothetical protein